MHNSSQFSSLSGAVNAMLQSTAPRMHKQGGVSTGRLMKALVATGIVSGGTGYVGGFRGGSKHQYEIDKEVYGLRISKLMAKQREGIKDRFQDLVVGR